MREEKGQYGAAVDQPLLGSLGGGRGGESGGLMGVYFLTLSYYFLVGAANEKGGRAVALDSVEGVVTEQENLEAGEL